MAQDKKKSPVQIAGENEAMAADNVTVDPAYVAAVEAEKAKMDSTLQAERIIALEEAENAPVPKAPTVEDFFKQAKKDASAEVAQKFSLFDIAKDLGLEFKPFKKGEK
jgi:hypothetical protein